jgi:hypothetical protein
MEGRFAGYTFARESFKFYGGRKYLRRVLTVSKICYTKNLMCFNSHQYVTSLQTSSQERSHFARGCSFQQVEAATITPSSSYAASQQTYQQMAVPTVTARAVSGGCVLEIK